MTLKELIEMKIVRDNIRILVEKDEDIVEDRSVVRMAGRVVEESDLRKAGVSDKALGCEVIELWGDRDKFKMAIIVKAE